VLCGGRWEEKEVQQINPKSDKRQTFITGVDTRQNIANKGDERQASPVPDKGVLQAGNWKWEGVTRGSERLCVKRGKWKASCANPSHVSRWGEKLATRFG